jgi:hypothetical protein
MRGRLMMPVALIVGVGVGVFAPAASGDGLPVPGVTVDPGGVTNGTDRFTTSRVGSNTVITRSRVDGGEILDIGRIPGEFTLPAVAVDGTPGGLSADGSSLVLIRPRAGFPQSVTHLAVLDARRLAVHPRRLRLRGDFSFDAISPDGSRVYLIQYLDRRDPTNYSVRAMNADTGRLQPHPIVDPHETDPAEMRGFPATRQMSPDGRWAYTLYTGSGKPFVHALDTLKGRAHCVDLPVVSGNVYNDGMTISPGGEELTIANRHGATLATVNTTTFEAKAPADTPPSSSGNPGDGTDWMPIVLGALAAAICALGLGMFLRRRRRAVAAPG